MFEIEKDEREDIEKIIDLVRQIDKDGLLLIERDANTLLVYKNVRENYRNGKEA